MDKKNHAFTNRRHTSCGFFNNQDKQKQSKVGNYIPYKERKIISDEEKTAHFSFGKIYLIT